MNRQPNRNYGRCLLNAILILLALAFLFTVVALIFILPEGIDNKIAVACTVLALFVGGIAKFFQPRIVDFFNRVIQGFHIAGFLNGITRIYQKAVPGILIWLLIATPLAAIKLYDFGAWGISTRSTHEACASGLCVTQEADGQLIGISDGRAAFDLSRANRQNKIDAANALQRGDSATAAQDLDDAVQSFQDSNDAEALIYRENIAIANAPHVTIIVVTMLSGDPTSVGLGRSVLQGAYMVQREVNSCSLGVTSCLTLPGQKKVRLLIANVGDKSSFAVDVANKIVEFARMDAEKDKTFVGVMGWPSSTEQAKEGITLLDRSGIPMVSPIATSDDLTSSTSANFFFRVCPPNSEYASVAAQYAKTILKSRNAVIFYNPSFPYSQTLADDFQHSFFGTAHLVSYTRGDRASLHQALVQALQFKPDLIYFTSYTDDLSFILNDPLLAAGQRSHVHVMGGSALYILGGYADNSYKELYYTAPAYPDEWNYIPATQSPLINAFSKEYQADFDRFGQHINTASVYGYIRSDGYTMLAYDAMRVLLEAVKRTRDVNVNTIQQTLVGIGSQTAAIQGVSGQIAFSTSTQPADGNPVNKTVLVLCVSSDGTTHLDQMQRQFLLNTQSTNTSGQLSAQYCDPDKF